MCNRCNRCNRCSRFNDFDDFDFFDNQWNGGNCGCNNWNNWNNNDNCMWEAEAFARDIDCRRRRENQCARRFIHCLRCSRNRF